MAWADGQGLQDGKYTIDKRLGEGGFGITYRAKDNHGRYVVIKTLNETVQRRRDFVRFQQDFLNEAIKLAKCNHPYVVRIDEVIQEDSLWCIVMEYIDGEDLASRVENQGALPEEEALPYIRQIGEALTVVHNNGLLHRDIKPQNIMLRSGKSEAVLIDFGIAREFTQNLTQTHTQMLADGFAPIEQYDKRAKRGAYTDVYALAATLYSLLTQEVPTMAPLRAIGTLLEEPKKINPSISDKVNQAILKGMEIKPENRPQSVQEWLTFLGTGIAPTIPSTSKHSLVIPVNSSPAISGVSVDYSKLDGLLAAGRWKEADEETTAVMLKLSGREREGYLDSEAILKFPCQDLSTIDQLWLISSNRHFGFSVQKRIWQSLGGKPGKFNEEIWVSFGERVGWRSTRHHQILFASWTTREWSYYSQIKFTLDAPEGHLPRMWDEWRGGLELCAIVSRFLSCDM
ncbi:serine/threonine-protein kinase [Scytonema sp. PRP1]|uniref:serine/threonine-protein kinase n=1 Tax=Scytonema sp. PRP1 TaxID=3120513 RepID=UPI002FD4C0D4